MKKNVVKVHHPMDNSSNQRRRFLKLSGMALAGTGLLVACSNDDDGGMRNPDGNVFDLGSGDLGILNYAYALEQLEADFYTKVVNGSYWSGAADEEKQILQDLYNHEVNHREFFSAAISAAVGADMSLKLPTLEFDYGGLNFNDRASVLGTAKVLEDTGVAAYNGAGQFISNPDYLVLAGKIVSVEARHAAAIRDLLNPGSADFAGDDQLDSNGLDKALKPAAILDAVGATGFIVTPFTATSLRNL
ncbi:Ferritin-like domain-containing protein [Flavobacteriaceae bacterium MAR_2010_188]|nr:Ferritin-like domain-containing protein [Flavobacteriaceae bacterium MAR_2010_188]